MKSIDRPLGTEHIRRGVERDLPAILAIETACFTEPWPQEFLRRQLGQAGCFVYAQGDVIYGYIIIGLRHSWPLPLVQLKRQLRSWLGRSSQPPERPQGHVLNLAVAPPRRRQGIARALLQTGLEELQLRRARWVDLEVRVTNEAAIRLYQEFGFQIIARLPRYYRQAEDAHLMRKCFQP